MDNIRKRPISYIVSIVLALMLISAGGLTAYATLQNGDNNTMPSIVGDVGTAVEQELDEITDQVSANFNPSHGVHDVQSGWVTQGDGYGTYTVYDLGLRMSAPIKEVFLDNGTINSGVSAVYRTHEIAHADAKNFSNLGTMLHGNPDMRFSYKIKVGESINDLYFINSWAGSFYPAPDADIIGVDAMFPGNLAGLTSANRMSVVTFWGKKPGITTFRIINASTPNVADLSPYAFTNTIDTNMVNEVAIDVRIEVVENSNIEYNKSTLIEASDINSRIKKSSYVFSLSDLLAPGFNESEYTIIGTNNLQGNRINFAGHHSMLNRVVYPIEKIENTKIAKRKGIKTVNITGSCRDSFEAYEVIIKRTRSGQKDAISHIPVYLATSNVNSLEGDMVLRNAYERTFVANEKIIDGITRYVATQPGSDRNTGSLDSLYIDLQSVTTNIPYLAFNRDCGGGAFQMSSIIELTPMETRESSNAALKRDQNFYMHRNVNIPYHAVRLPSSPDTNAPMFLSNPTYKDKTPVAAYPGSIKDTEEAKPFNISSKSGVVIKASDIARVPDNNTMEIVNITSYSGGMINASIEQKDGKRVLYVTGGELFSEVDGDGNVTNPLGVYGNRGEVIVGVMNTTKLANGEKAQGYGQMSYISVYITVDESASGVEPSAPPDMENANSNPQPTNTHNNFTIYRNDKATYRVGNSIAETIAIDNDAGDSVAIAGSGSFFRYRTNSINWVFMSANGKVTIDGGKEIFNVNRVDGTKLELSPLAIFDPQNFSVDNVGLRMELRVQDSKGGESYIPIVCEVKNHSPEANSTLKNNPEIAVSATGVAKEVTYSLPTDYDAGLNNGYILAQDKDGSKDNLRITRVTRI